MNRLTDYLKLLNSKERPEVHLNVLELSVPQTTEELNTFVVGLAKTMAQSCLDSKPTLAALACVITDKEGFMPYLIDKIAENTGRDEGLLALAFMAVLGRELFCAEISLLKDK